MLSIRVLIYIINIIIFTVTGHTAVENQISNTEYDHRLAFGKSAMSPVVRQTAFSSYLCMLVDELFYDIAEAVQKLLYG